MILTIQDWVFDVDVTSTMAYYSMVSPDHCTCGYCRNFYTAADRTYPGLRTFLSQFGVNVEAPEELMPLEPTLCVVSYCVSGSVLKAGNHLIELDGFMITVQDKDQIDYNSDCPKPYFVLTTSFLDLPWLLEEDMNDVVSPANEPECLERMWRKLLESTDYEPIQS